MKKVIAVILYTIIIVNLVGGIVFFYNNNPPQQNNTNQNATNTALNSSAIIPNISVNNSKSNSEKILLSDLEKHNSKSDCWVSYKGKVYDITSWLPDHPGSADAIAPYCGKAEEFEQAFTGQHGTTQVKKLMEEGTYKGELEQ